MKSNKRKTVTSAGFVTGCCCTPIGPTLIKILKTKGPIKDKINKFIKDIIKESQLIH